ncbi:HAD family hydrolase [Nocardioides hungaricus]
MPLIALDLDGTLVDQAAAARTWAREFADKWDLPGTAVDKVAAALTARRSKGEVFAELVERLKLPAAVEGVWLDYRTRMPDLVAVTDGDRRALTDLRAAGWTLGIVTNGMADNQEGKIRRTGLDALVDGWAISEEVGARKPDQKVFRALAERLGCPLDGWMIGDSLELDIAGGACVGLKTAWINDDGTDPTTYSCRPDLIVDSVAAAAAVILASESG